MGIFKDISEIKNKVININMILSNEIDYYKQLVSELERKNERLEQELEELKSKKKKTTKKSEK